MLLILLLFVLLFGLGFTLKLFILYILAVILLGAAGLGYIGSGRN